MKWLGWKTGAIERASTRPIWVAIAPYFLALVGLIGLLAAVLLRDHLALFVVIPVVAFLALRELVKSLDRGFRPDDAGVRIKRWGWRRYIAFDQIERAEAVPTTLAGLPQIVLHGAGGKLLFRKRRVDPFDMERATNLFAAWERWKKARSSPATPDTRLARNGDPLDAWLERLTAESAGNPYRSAGWEPEPLQALLANPAAPVEERAASAWLLLRSGDEPTRRAALEIMGERTPPLVVAVANSAANGVPPALVQEASKYLPRADKRILAKMKRVRVEEPRETRQRVRVPELEPAPRTVAYVAKGAKSTQA